MTGLARFVLRRRRTILLVWLALTLLGAYSANAVSKRWLEQFSIPGYSAYEANQRTLKTFGTGENAPLVPVFHSSGDVTKQRGIVTAIAAVARRNPGSRVSSYFSTGSDAYVSKDRHTTFAEVYPPGKQGFGTKVHIKDARAAMKKAAARRGVNQSGSENAPELNALSRKDPTSTPGQSRAPCMSNMPSAMPDAGQMIVA